MRHLNITKRLITIAAVMLFALSVAQAQNIEEFVTRQMQTYPKSRLLDLYKSCFQEYMGAEHLVSDRQRVKAYLNEELSLTALEDLQPWYYEPCGVDSNFFRVSIRTVKEGLITEDALLDAFIRSANSQDRPSVESWREQWHKILGTIDQMNLSLPHYAEDRQFIDSILSAGKYAISHSPDYREAYNPHYRIVRRDIFEQEIKPMIDMSTMIVRIAEIEVYHEYLEAYLAAAKNVGAESVKNEPGVICIFPNQLKVDDGEHQASIPKFRIVEIYSSSPSSQYLSCYPGTGFSIGQCMVMVF